MAQHRRANSPGQDSAVHLHLKEKGHSCKDASVLILDREDGWFDRRVMEAIFVHCEWPSLNKGGGLRHQLSTTDSLESPSQALEPPLTLCLRWPQSVKWKGVARSRSGLSPNPPGNGNDPLLFFTLMAHVMTNMLNSRSSTFRTTSKLDGPD